LIGFCIYFLLVDEKIQLEQNYQKSQVQNKEVFMNRLF
jgi:hypothetical protein